MDSFAYEGGNADLGFPLAWMPLIFGYLYTDNGLTKGKKLILNYILQIFWFKPTAISFGNVTGVRIRKFMHISGLQAIVWGGGIGLIQRMLATEVGLETDEKKLVPESRKKFSKLHFRI